jgi:hypothetical protein
MGNKNDTEYNFKYNYDSQVSFIISLTKISYSKGETVTGTMFLKTKPYLQETILYNPQASISFIEFQHSGEQETDFDIYGSPSNNKLSKKEKIYFTYPLNLFAYNGANLYAGVNINFFVNLPKECSSSCFIDNNTYIKHFILIDFPTIRAKKSEAIIIKNTKYYTLENKLYKTPIISKLETSKHKYAVFNMGEIKATMTLSKNSFKYNETIYFIVEIDASKLTIEINSIKVSLIVNLKTRESNNSKDVNINKSIEIITKNIKVKKGEKRYYIDEFIKMPDNSYNPENLHKKYDGLKKLKFNNETFLYQPCYNDIINIQYSIRAMIEINSLFSTNEFMEIPIDFYADENINNNENKNVNIKNNNNNNNLENDDDELPSLEEIIKGDNQKKVENKIDDNGNFNINYVDNINNYYNNNDKGNENNNKIENSGAPPSFGEFI